MGLGGCGRVGNQASPWFEAERGESAGLDRDIIIIIDVYTLGFHTHGLEFTLSYQQQRSSVAPGGARFPLRQPAGLGGDQCSEQDVENE